jgi:hypothetical protein
MFRTIWQRVWEVKTPSTTERRQWRRHLSHAETVCEPAGDGTRLPARVRDVSFGGISLMVRQRLAQGNLLHVNLPGSDSEPRLLACVVQVSEPAEGSWALGCTFIRELNEQELNRFLSPPPLATGPLAGDRLTSSIRPRNTDQ